MQVGRKIFYDKKNGNVILDTGERQGDIINTSVNQDIESYSVLSERVRDTFDVIELVFGTYAQDFAECSGYRVNPATKTLEFSYQTPGEETLMPVFQKPLTEQMSELQSQLTSALDAIDFLLMGGV